MRRLLTAIILATAFGGWGAPPPAAEADSAGPELAGLPPGPGREAVKYTCRACHSLRQFTQQRLDREAWDGLLAEMVKKNGMAEPEPWARNIMLAYLSTHFGTAEADSFGGLPVGPGQEDTYYACDQCHSIRLVLQQRLDRDSWDETLDWMVEEQGMTEPEPDLRALLLNYLSTYLGRDVPR